MDTEFQDPCDLLNKTVRTPRGVGTVTDYTGIFAVVNISGRAVRVHWSHCKVVAC